MVGDVLRVVVEATGKWEPRGEGKWEGPEKAGSATDDQSRAQLSN